MSNLVSWISELEEPKNLELTAYANYKAINFMKTWEPSEKDFEHAKFILDEELIRPLNEKNIFLAGIYCILAATENYQKQLKVYNELLANGLDNAFSVLHNQSDLEKIIKKTRFPNEKLKRINGYSTWWSSEQDLIKDLLYDATHKKKKSKWFREKLSEAPGIRYKSATLLLTKCGYHNIATIDVWMLRYLKAKGYDVIVSNYKTNSGPNEKNYEQYEDYFIELSDKMGVSPALLQAAIWGKFSAWTKKQGQKKLTHFE